MYKKQIVLKKDTTDAEYTKICNLMEKQGVFVSCGDCENKWVLGEWENKIDFAAWYLTFIGARAV